MQPDTSGAFLVASVRPGVVESHVGSQTRHQGWFLGKVACEMNDELGLGRQRKQEGVELSTELSLHSMLPTAGGFG